MTDFIRHPSRSSIIPYLLSVLACLSLLAVAARAGSLQPSASPAGTMRTLLEVSSKDSGNTFDRSTDSLEAIRDRSDLLAPASTALSSSAWTSSRAAFLDYLGSDLKYLYTNSVPSPASGSVAAKATSAESYSFSLDARFGAASGYSSSYPSGTSLFLALKDIRDTLSSTLTLSGSVTASSFSGSGTGLTGLSASNISSGTLGADRYSAYADLTAESKIGTSSGQLMPGDADSWVNASGDTMSGALYFASGTSYYADASGNGSFAALSSSGDLAVGGGYGSTGLTLTSAGDLWLDGDIYQAGDTYAVDSIRYTGNLEVADILKVGTGADGTNPDFLTVTADGEIENNKSVAIYIDKDNNSIETFSVKSPAGTVLSLDESGALALNGNLTAAAINGLTLTSSATGFTLSGGTSSKTLTVDADLSASGINSHLASEDLHLTSAENTWIDAVTASSAEVNLLDLSGLSAGQVLRASGDSLAAWQALAWADIDKATSSLADLATRSAGDLSSGLLAHERGGLEADVSAYSGLLKITGGATSSITDNSAHWDAAYGWGDHASAGYAPASSVLWTDAGSYIRPNNYSSLSITDDGKVGIGTTSPSYALDVSGQANASGGICIAGDCKTAWNQVGADAPPVSDIWSLSGVGETWAAKDSARPWWENGLDVSADGQYMVSVTFGGQIYVSSDYGATWAAKDSSRAWEGAAVSSSGQYMSATDNGGQIYVSSNYGATWAAKASIQQWRGIAMSSDGKYQTAAAIITAGSGKIWVSSDYGATWAAKDSDREWYVVAVSSTGQYQSAGVFQGQIYLSSDYGQTWTAASAAGSRDWRGGLAMSADGRYLAAAVSDYGYVYVSSDYGATWAGKYSGLGWNGLAMSADGRYLAAAIRGGSQLYVSSDYGENWAAKDSSRDWRSIAMSSTGQYMAAGVYNGQIYVSYAAAANQGNVIAAGNITASGGRIYDKTGYSGIPGEMRMYGGASAPNGWLLCDGSSLLRADYADLFAAIGTTYGSADGTHFNLPNFKGIFPRGAGSQTIGEQTFTGTLGTTTGDSTALPNNAFVTGTESAGHQHVAALKDAGSYSPWGTWGSTGLGVLGAAATNDYYYTKTSGALSNHTHNVTIGGDSETAPANLGVNYIIKY